MERLDGWGEDTQNAIGTLPSETEWAMEQTYDNRNSSIERLDPQRHELAATLQYEHEEDNNLWQANAILPLNINIQNVYHRRYTYDRHTRVKHVFVNPSFSLWRIWDNRKKQWRINYSINTQVPDFIGQLLDFPNDNDPLNVATGNPDLKPAVTHNWKILLNARLSRHIAKVNLTVLIDGFDLLRQLSNHTFYMNSQGRFETITVR